MDGPNLVDLGAGNSTVESNASALNLIFAQR
jgi:hypothetical protein